MIMITKIYILLRLFGNAWHLVHCLGRFFLATSDIDLLPSLIKQRVRGTWYLAHSLGTLSTCRLRYRLINSFDKAK